MESILEEESSKQIGTLFLAYLAIGGILGDIGTSPLYVISLTFKNLTISKENVMGVLSLIFWSFMFLSAKYAGLALNLDNDGEGGTFTLMHLIQTEANKLKKSILRYKFTFIIGFASILSMICGALLLSDGVITPSISVLAAVEGIEVIYPHLAEFILPIATIILCALFFLQKRGTEKIAKLFSPIIIVWFVSIGLVGLKNLVEMPCLLKSINPYYALHFILSHPLSIVFPILGYVVLCITGGEALYADEAHYSKPAIRIAWGVAAICLLINYLGQGAFILKHPQSQNPFFDMSLPFGHAFYIYLLILATLAAIIASQAMITGSFSTYKQAMELRMLPRVEIRNTSHKTAGQIYIPTVNRAMFLACLTTVFIFKKSDALGDAYGLAVTGAFIGTTLMMTMLLFLKNYQQQKKFFMILPLLCIFLMFDSAFFFSNLGKIPTGGWFPLIIATFLVLTMLAWKHGSLLLYYAIPKMPLKKFVNTIKEEKPLVLKGTNIYMTLNPNEVPGCLLEEVKEGWIKQTVLFVSVQNTHLPWGIHYEKKLLIKMKDIEIYQIIINKGYMRLFVNVPNIIKTLGFETQPRRFVFSLWNPIITETSWKKLLLQYFRLIYKNTSSLTTRFAIPTEELLYIGKDIKLSFPKNKS
ncbi:KUP system potassium uptake protein [Desulfonauticus submarinus]|uniref:KUP system potassium uptake protein n=1 Tax=Desulfonauticus submarinus TaxID=206665 RepID=A0A1H0CCZ8_9BACT|nr:KUP/HAK/KT family potassium transporter [Desulfonauticus submarinus]SDN55784.1 KUP system potassium uptake protein [Desulfonauticus submarinus]